MASTLRFDNWEDSNGTPILDGTNLALPSSSLPAGSVLQVLQSSPTAIFSTTSTSFVDVTNFSASITPQSVNSKIFIIVSARMGFNSGSGINTRGTLKLSKPGLDLAESLVGGYFGGVSTNDMNQYNSVSFSVLDEPSTTSTIEYKISLASETSATTARVLTGGANSKENTITLMEIAG